MLLHSLVSCVIDILTLLLFAYLTTTIATNLLVRLWHWGLAICVVTDGHITLSCQPPHVFIACIVVVLYVLSRQSHCVFVELISMTNRVEIVYTHTGFSYWNDSGRSLKTHSVSDIHCEASMKLKEMATNPPINAVMDKTIKKQRLENNEKLVLIIKALKYLGRQNQAIRGTAVKDVSLLLLTFS